MAYNAASIEVLEGLEAVRKRPGMYIGGTDSHGFHHLLWEVIDNSVDEAINGHATEIVIEVGEDLRGASVRDDGRGIPFDMHPKHKRPAAEIIFTVLHAGGKFGGEGYKVSGGLHGVGSSVVNALSSEMVVTIHREGQKYTQAFSRGVPSQPKTVSAAKKLHGTEVVFRPDVEIFGKKLRFDLDLIKERCKTKAYLAAGVKFVVNGEVFQFSGGLIDLLGSRLETEDLEAVTEFPFVLEEKDLQVVLTWSTDPRQSDDLVQSFANGIPTRDGGTHMGGLKSAVTEAVKAWMQQAGVWPKRPQIEVQDMREGLVGAIHTFVENPQFQGQTKDRLNNPEVRGDVRKRVRKALLDWMSANREQSLLLSQRVIDAAKARTASRDARDRVRRQSAVSRMRRTPSCSSSRATARAALPSKAGIESSRRSSRCAGSPSTPSPTPSRRWGPTRRSRTSSRRWVQGWARTSTSPASATERSSCSWTLT
jgi:DNA gyrase subunit B